MLLNDTVMITIVYYLNSSDAKKPLRSMFVFGTRHCTSVCGSTCVNVDMSVYDMMCHVTKGDVSLKLCVLK